ncbi:F-box/LRR-repeat protein 6-like [Pollicipes pollicipes]|uniref:F-box/LRR-repeat protein 6-like n=1 Tax=Pollicipes pollicipes TaxID=41117 RepID=UPI001884AB68|nr:F-box/LRR-repeat protein 6-like [Pollicipes pollicipes]
MSRVCRLWRTAALEPSLWRSVDLATGLIRDKFRHERLLLWLIENRLSKTEELNLAGWSSALSPLTVPALCRGCPELRQLSLSGCRRLTGDEVTLLAGAAERVHTLDLSDLQPNSATARSPVGPHSMQELARLMGPRLVSLTLAHNCVAGMQQIVNALADHCPSLEVLDLSNIMNAIRDIVPVRVERLQAGCPRLRVLRWTNTELRLADTTLKEQMSAQGFPALEELSVAVPKGRHWGLDDAGVERVLKASHQLRLLDVRGCSRLSDSSLVRVPAWNLQHLFLSGCEVTRTMADRLELIVRKWRHSLLELDLSWASNQPALDAALLALAEPDLEQPPPPLRKLDLCGAAGTFAPVCRLVAACPALQELNLTSCRALPRGVKRHYRGDELERLRVDIAAGKYRDEPGPKPDKAEKPEKPPKTSVLVRLGLGRLSGGRSKPKQAVEESPPLPPPPPAPAKAEFRAPPSPVVRAKSLSLPKLEQQRVIPLRSVPAAPIPDSVAATARPGGAAAEIKDAFERFRQRRARIASGWPRARPTSA